MIAWSLEGYNWCCNDLKKLSEFSETDLLNLSHNNLWLNTYWFAIPLIYCPYCGKKNIQRR